MGRVSLSLLTSPSARRRNRRCLSSKPCSAPSESSPLSQMSLPRHSPCNSERTSSSRRLTLLLSQADSTSPQLVQALRRRSELHKPYSELYTQRKDSKR